MTSSTPRLEMGARVIPTSLPMKPNPKRKTQSTTLVNILDPFVERFLECFPTYGVALCRTAYASVCASPQIILITGHPFEPEPIEACIDCASTASQEHFGSHSAFCRIEGWSATRESLY